MRLGARAEIRRRAEPRPCSVLHSDWTTCIDGSPPEYAFHALDHPDTETEPAGTAWSPGRARGTPEPAGPDGHGAAGAGLRAGGIRQDHDLGTMADPPGAPRHRHRMADAGRPGQRSFALPRRTAGGAG